MDRAGRLFSVEVYKGKRFSWMFLLRFGGGRATAGRAPLSDRSGPETSPGF